MSNSTDWQRAIETWQRLDFEWAAAELDKIDVSDPERAHGQADDILWANAHPALAEAYDRLQKRAAWWASA